MNADQHWALFMQEGQVSWEFGNPDEEFKDVVTNFIAGLSDFGEELVGENGIANIAFDITKHAGLQTTKEIFIVSLMENFHLLMSDPATTMKLVKAKGGINPQIEEFMSAVLVGQASIIFAQSISEASETTRKNHIKLWQEIILELSSKYEDDIDRIINKDSSNFSMIDFEDLLFLHYYLRQLPTFQSTSPRKWAIVIDKEGLQSPLRYRLEKDPIVLGGYLGVIATFLNELFDAKPKTLIFGSTNIQKMHFFNGKNYLFVTDSSILELARDKAFLDRLFGLDEPILKDISEPLRFKIIDEMLEQKARDLENMDIKALFDMQH